MCDKNNQETCYHVYAMHPGHDNDLISVYDPDDIPDEDDLSYGEGVEVFNYCPYCGKKL